MGVLRKSTRVCKSGKSLLVHDGSGESRAAVKSHSILGHFSPNYFSNGFFGSVVQPCCTLEI